MLRLVDGAFLFQLGLVIVFVLIGVRKRKELPLAVAMFLAALFGLAWLFFDIFIKVHSMTS